MKRYIVGSLSRPSHKVCAVAVAYNPERQIVSNMLALAQQVDRIFIVDNGSSPESKSYLCALDNVDNIVIAYNSRNAGIAAALNIGVKLANESGQRWDWIATFDQDSVVAHDFIERMLEAYGACRYKEKIALISPIYLDAKTGTIKSFALKGPKNSLFSEIRTTMTSGNLVKPEALSVAGGFDESFFIDYVDTEFCLRCRQHGFRLIEASGAVLTHSQGNMSRHTFFWREVTTTNHSAMRHYYKARNKTVVYLRYFLQEPGWVIKGILDGPKEVVKIVLYEDRPLPKLGAMLKGIFHAMIGRMGK